MKNNLGIFLTYSPWESIKGHGISRLLSFILHAIQQSDDNHLIIATPKWFEKSIIEFLEEQQINTKQIEILTTPGIPIIVRIIRYFFSRKKVHRQETAKSYPHEKAKKVFRKIKKSLQLLNKASIFLLARWAATSSLLIFIGIGLLIGTFFLLLLLPASILITLTNVLIMTMLIKKNASQFIRKIKKTNLRPRLLLKIRHYWNKINKSNLPAIKEKVAMFARKIYIEVRKSEINKLIQIINTRPEIKAWLIPSLFRPEIKNIKTKKIVAAPDIVFIDFPSYFASENSLLTTTMIAETINAADHLICYSDYVKQKHLMQTFTVDPDKITVIPHGVTELSHIFANDPTNKAGATVREQSIRILQKYQQLHLQHDSYLADYNFSDMRFIFYSSQLRPYKNMFNLVRAFEILLRERYLNIKLIVTADLKADSELYRYILEKRLQFDILSFYDVSTEVLSALNHLAICAVNPTLFEGGFPFTFNEAYSVGTPSIMSHIPVVLEEISDESLREQMLFDPYNLNDMIDKIEWAVKNADQLFELQAPLYQKFKQRSWGLVAKEYVNLLTDFTQVTHEPA